MIFWSTKTQHHPAYQNFCLLNHGGWVGELKYQVFPKDFITEYKLYRYQVFSKAFIKSWNWDRALWALALRPLDYN